MTITDSQSVSFGLLAMYVEDMYSAALGSLNPPADPRIAAQAIMFRGGSYAAGAS